MTDGYVYLVATPGGNYKIGMTTDIESRMRIFANSLPCPSMLIHVMQSNHAERLERELHDMYEGRRYRGEWFKLTSLEVRNILMIGTVIYKQLRPLSPRVLVAPAPVEKNRSQKEKAHIRLVKAAIAAVGADATTIPSRARLGWSAATWQHAINGLREYVVCKSTGTRLKHDKCANLGALLTALA